MTQRLMSEGGYGHMHYQILDRIGSTTGSHLHRGQSLPDGTAVLLKVLDPEHVTPPITARLRREYEILKSLNLPGVVKPLALLEHDPPMIVLDCPAGELLESVLSRGPLDLPTCLRLASQAADILAGLHAAHLIHRDLRPANLMLTSEGRVCLLDLCLPASDTSGAAVSGTPPAGDWAYISPEQTGRMNRTVDHRTDFYSLGVTLYRMLTGQLPFQGHDALEWVHCHIARSPRPPKQLVADIPQVVSDIVMKLLAKNAEERYQTALGLKFDLEKCLTRWSTGKTLAAFPLAKRDTPEQLLIPRKLYGREREADTLLGVFHRVVESGTPEVMMVTGYSGIGKTSLVRELCKPVLGRHGYFISGKFDQHSGDIPFSRAPDLFRELSQQILVESEERIADWKRRIKEAVGVYGQLIVDVIPEVELIIGKQPPVPELPLAESRNRFSMVFRKFACVFGSKEHPLVVFLDDIQWIDLPGLKLLAHIITHPQTKYLFFIGAYRENEVAPPHPLLSTLDEMRRSGTPVHTIDLSPLSPRDVGCFMADTFRTGPRRVAPLAKLVHEKTGGNPLFVIQFLRTLADEKLIELDRQKRCWQWDVLRIQEKDYTDNVASFMVGKLQKLSKNTLHGMRIAACIGNRFNLPALSAIVNLPMEETAASLEEGVREGLLLRRNGDYSFLHDRIQEAAYSSVPEKDLAGLHLLVGRFLLANTPENLIEESIFDIANHLNRGAAFINQQEERVNVARLNLRVARKAKAASAYQTSAGYLAAGIALLDSNMWERQHDLAFALHLELAEAELHCGALDEAKSYFPVLLHRATTPVEKAAAYRVKIDTHNIAREGDDAITSALECLRMLGVDMSAHPSDTEVQEAYTTIWNNLGDRRIEALIDLPLMTDPDKQAAMEILSRLYIPAYYSDNNLFYLHICHGVNLSLQNGNAAASTYAYGWFGVLLATVFDRPLDGQTFAGLAFDLMERYRFLAYKATVFILLKFVAYWSQSVDKMIEYSRAMFEAGVETGDVAAACFSFSETLLGMISRGDRLSEVHRQAERGLEFVRTAGFREVIDQVIMLDRFVLAMRGQTHHLSTFDDESFSEAEFEARLPEQRIATLVFFYHAVKLMGRFLSGDLEAALASGKKSQALLWAGLFSVQSHYFYVYYALTLSALFDRFSPAERQETLDVLAAHEDQLRKWAKNSLTFHSPHALVCAEIARITGKELTAMRLYEEAVKSAHDNGFVQNEALANEVAAHFYLGLGFEKIACAYLREARSCYLRWQADGKVRQLDERYPWLREEDPSAPIGPAQVTDAITVVKGSQAISGEILLSNLLDRLMKIVLENGGAQVGYLLLTRGDELSIEAGAWVEGEIMEVEQEASLLSLNDLPLSIINYVRRTRQMVILDDASLRNMFSLDEYIIRNKPVSILCLPVLRQTHLIGLLYLENNLARGAFTANRISVLEMLAAQAAISLQNSTLYASLQKAREELEQRVEERTEELSRANAKLQELDRLKSMFIASMSHELRTPLNSVIGFSSLILEEWFGTLNAEQKENLAIVLRAGKHLLSLINDVIDVSKIEAGTVETLVEDFDVHDVISEAVATLTKDIQDKNLVLEVDAPHCRMRTDRRRLLQCVLNLVSNATKFTEKGFIRIGVRPVQEAHQENSGGGASSRESDRDYIQIFVEDTGIGIKEEDTPKLYNAFARIESPIKAPGTGLGLYLTKKITTELLKGEIGCRTTYGEGSRFFLKLPVKT